MKDRKRWSDGKEDRGLCLTSESYRWMIMQQQTEGREKSRQNGRRRRDEDEQCTERYMECYKELRVSVRVKGGRKVKVRMTITEQKSKMQEKREKKPDSSQTRKVGFKMLAFSILTQTPVKTSLAARQIQAWFFLLNSLGCWKRTAETAIHRTPYFLAN